MTDVGSTKMGISLVDCTVVGSTSVLKSDVAGTKLLTTNIDHTNGSSRMPMKGKTGGPLTGSDNTITGNAGVAGVTLP